MSSIIRVTLSLCCIQPFENSFSLRRADHPGGLITIGYHRTLQVRTVHLKPAVPFFAPHAFGTPVPPRTAEGHREAICLLGLTTF